MDIKDSLEKGKDLAEGAVDKVKDVAGDAVDKAKEIGGNVGDMAENAVDKVKDAAGDAVDKVKEAAANATKEGSFLDKLKDKAETLTGIDINRDGKIGDKPKE
jgi:gas vesicle protein